MDSNSQNKSAVSTTLVQDQKQGEVNLGGYSIHRQKRLGSGSYSKVFLCESKKGSKAAVKILNKTGQRCSQIIKVAKAEAKTLKQLDHPSITKYLGSYESEHNFYILFQYHEGYTLKQFIRKRYKLTPIDHKTIIKHLILAFSYLYGKKIMHRDIKPENIMYDFKRAALIDFGFACSMQNGDSTVLKEWIGTPSYMSPEMLQHRKYNWKSDIWSFGVTVYEIVYGVLPWTGANQQQLLSNIQNKPLSLPNTTSKPIQTLLSQCLDISVERRINWNDLFRFAKVGMLDTIEVEIQQMEHVCYCWKGIC